MPYKVKEWISENGIIEFRETSSGRWQELYYGKPRYLWYGRVLEPGYVMLYNGYASIIIGKTAFMSSGTDPKRHAGSWKHFGTEITNDVTMKTM